MIEKLNNKKFRELLRKYYWVETQLARKHHDSRINPYEICDWIQTFTPIERNVWHDIRVIGLPMWPQYPILNYFVDFADPIEKIIIEVDGKEWHQDKEKDLERQNEIEKFGWIFYRIEGKQTFDDTNSCYGDCDYVDEEDKIRCDKKYYNCSEYIIKEIKKTHYTLPKELSNILYKHKSLVTSENIEDILKRIGEENIIRNELIDYYNKYRPIITI